MRRWCRANDRKNMDLQKEMDQGDEALGKRINMLRAMVVNEYARKAKPGPDKPREQRARVRRSADFARYTSIFFLS